MSFTVIGVCGLGWAVNQLTVGNNLALRMRAISERDRFSGLRTKGPQHQTFEDTLPSRRRSDG
jgi:hypothetical protein